MAIMGLQHEICIGCITYDAESEVPVSNVRKS